jgi:phosphoribosylaminoimidazole-succinocarboxamide synthase
MHDPAQAGRRFPGSPMHDTGGVSASSDTNDWNHVYSGKVRDLYEPAEGPEDVLLVVASDRVSAFDHVLEPGIPGKGELLTSLSLWWFDQLRNVPNHLVPDHRLDDSGVAVSTIPAAFAGRAMLVRKLDMFPVECVVRGYLTGSGWKEYVASRTVCGIPLPDGLRDGDQLPEPLFTPAYKAPLGEHDENISFSRMVELIGEDDAVALKDLSLEIYRTASITAERHGVILADTKFEFGRNPETGVITLGDEVLTSDSSRYWDRDVYLAGDDPAERMASFDKQIVRDWLAHNWDQHDEATPTPPTLPSEIVTQTAARYRELLERLTGLPAAR